MSGERSDIPAKSGTTTPRQENLPIQLVSVNKGEGNKRRKKIATVYVMNKKICLETGGKTERDDRGVQ